MRVRLRYRPDDWAPTSRPDGAPQLGLYIAELDGFPPCAGLGPTDEEAISALAADLIASIDADDNGEGELLRLARRAELVDALLAAAEPAVLDSELPDPPT